MPANRNNCHTCNSNERYFVACNAFTHSCCPQLFWFVWRFSGNYNFKIICIAENYFHAIIFRYILVVCIISVVYDLLKTDLWFFSQITIISLTTSCVSFTCMQAFFAIAWKILTRPTAHTSAQHWARCCSVIFNGFACGIFFVFVNELWLRVITLLFPVWKICLLLLF